MNNQIPAHRSSPAAPRRRGITQEYVAQLVVAFMQLYACILALPGGYEALQAAQEIITSDAKRPANSIVFPFRQTKGRLWAKQKGRHASSELAKAAKRERLTDHIPQSFYHTRQPISKLGTPSRYCERVP